MILKDMRTPSISYLSLGLAALLFFGAGCGTSQVTPAQTQGTSNGNAVAIGENVTIPTNFPTDLPRYPNATTRIAMTDESQNSATLNQDSSDSLNTIKASLVSSLQNSGFTANVISDTPDFYLASFDKNTTHIQLQLVHNAQKQITNILISRVTR